MASHSEKKKIHNKEPFQELNDYINDSQINILTYSGQGNTSHPQTLASVSPKTHSATEVSSKDVRIVLYESPNCSPYITIVSHHTPISSYIEEISQATHKISQMCDISFPYPIIKSLVENFTHADFCDPIISIFNKGASLRLSDQGKGISNKEACLQPGFTTAQVKHKNHISGVGSGLVNIKHFADMSGGTLLIQDNINRGTVITLCLQSSKDDNNSHSGNTFSDSRKYFSEEDFIPAPAPPKHSSLSIRQQEVLVTIADCENAGPSKIARLLGISVSTAHRDLQFLESHDYLLSKEGKRTITSEGIAYLEQYIFNSNLYH